MLNFYKYAGTCNEFEQELKQSLTRENINALRNDCSELGIHNWFEWMRKNDDVIAKFLSSPPSARKKKAWQTDPLKSRLVFAAIQYVKNGRNLLEGIDDLVVHHGCSYREMAAKAGQVTLDVFHLGILHWPFEGPSPFE
jgi:hypothetical protein